MADTITTWTPISAPTDFQDDAVFNIDFKTKTVQVLVEQPIVAGENLSQFIKFQAPRYYDNIDLTNMSVNILYVSPAGNKGISAAVNAEYSDDMIRCGWLVPYAACPQKGTLHFVLEFVGADYALKTTVATTPVLDSINDEDVVPEPAEQAWYITLQANVSATLQAAQTALGRVEGIFNALGTPMTAGTAAEMVDETAIYVYTGSETGYTYGNWYYYDGSAWVSGGTYVSTALYTDPTPTQGSTNAVRSGGVYDEIEGVKEGIDSIAPVIVGKNKYNPLISQPANNHVWASNGTYSESSNFATSGKIPVEPNTQYIFSAGGAFSTGGAYVLSVRFFSGETGNTFISGTDIRNTAFTTPENCTYVAVNLFGSAHTEEQYTTAIATAQLELGSTVTEYEPYAETRIVNLDKVEHGAEIAEILSTVPELSRDVADLQTDISDLAEIKDIFHTVTGKNKYNPAVCNPADNYVWASNGTYSASTSWATTGKIPVEPSTQYIFSAGGAVVKSVRYFSGETGGTFISGADINGLPFTTPENCTYIAINLFNGTHTAEQYTAAIASAQLELGNTATAYEPYAERPELAKANVEDGELLDVIPEITTKQSQINLYDKSLARDGVYINDSNGNTYIAAKFAITGKIPVKPNTQYNLSKAYDAPMTLSNKYYEYDSNGAFLRYKTTPSKYGVVPFVTSSDAAFVAINMTLDSHTTQDFEDTINTLMLCYGCNRPLEYSAYNLVDVVPNDKLGDSFFDSFEAFTGKRWAVFGTSISWYDGMRFSLGLHTGELCHGYVGYVAGKKKLHVSNHGVSGSSLGDVNSSSFINNYTNFDFTQIDICTIEFGVNDLGYNVPVGTAQDAAGTTTFAACLKTVIEYAFAQNPLIRIVICTEPDVTGSNANSNGNTLQDYTDVTLEIAKQYRLPVCDWYYHVGINELNKGGRDYDYLTIDGKHPSNEGHRRMAAMLNQVFDSLLC